MSDEVVLDPTPFQERKNKVDEFVEQLINEFGELLAARLNDFMDENQEQVSDNAVGNFATVTVAAVLLANQFGRLVNEKRIEEKDCKEGGHFYTEFKNMYEAYLNGYIEFHKREKKDEV